MKLKELLNQITSLPWKLEGNHVQDGGNNSIAVVAQGWTDDQPNAEYMLHAANVLPQLVEAVRRQCDDIYHPDLLEALKIAEDVKMPNDES